ncbi:MULTISPECIES: tetratricopeptide repeat protein [unclassified Sphingopyxis]|uniref:tetratricopeptide repeat protein n=1 Tax=unclassified Sphingopyxis TaxID=2614943 RepID=UPI000DC6262B|nr:MULTISPECIES: tetratricopeptide repeat protein [unclassified Sphingopyxis]BBB08335.1 tetratricopeptide TPR_2 [Sphingopyxis sp. EG6]
MFTRFRSMPATAMAAVLGCALMATATPAAAQKKEKPKKEEAAKGKQLTASKGFAPALKKMTDANSAKDAAALQAALTEAQASASTPDDKYLVGFYQLQLGILGKDQALQGQGLDVMLESGLTPAENIGVYNFYSGNFAYGAKNYTKAIQRLEAAKAAGSTEAALAPMLMDSYLNAGQIDKGWEIAQAGIASARAAGTKPSEELFVRPAQAFQKANRTNEMLDVLTMRVQDYPTPATWRNTLYILLQQSGGDKELNLDILRLMRATNSMTQRPEYLEYAGLATEAGYPGEVVALIKHGQNSGAIPKTDAHFGGILESQTPRATADAAAVAADATKPATLSNPKAARATADALVGNGDAAKAIPLYQAALAASPTDAVIQYRLGVAQALAGQSDAAVASFAKVQGNRQRLAQLWTVRAKAGAAPAAAPAATPAS